MDEPATYSPDHLLSAVPKLNALSVCGTRLSATCTSVESFDRNTLVYVSVESPAPPNVTVAVPPLKSTLSPSAKLIVAAVPDEAPLS